METLGSTQAIWNSLASLNFADLDHDIHKEEPSSRTQHLTPIHRPAAWSEPPGAQEDLFGSRTVVRTYRPTTRLPPANLQSSLPAGKTFGIINVSYPNFTVEAGKSHGSCEQLFLDADEKQFASITGMVVYHGLGSTYMTKTVRQFLERDAVLGSVTYTLLSLRPASLI